MYHVHLITANTAVLLLHCRGRVARETPLDQTGPSLTMLSPPPACESSARTPRCKHCRTQPVASLSFCLSASLPRSDAESSDPPAPPGAATVATVTLLTAPRPNTRHNILVRAAPHVRPGRLHRPRTAEDLRQQHAAVKLDAKSPLSPTTVSGDTIGFGHAMWATESIEQTVYGKKKSP